MSTIGVCLYRPEIPQNTGSIARLMAAVKGTLHLVRPYGFSIDEKNVRRAGLDYWPYVDLKEHDDIESVITRCDEPPAFLSARSDIPYTEIPKSCSLLVFGQETRGLPDFLWEKYKPHFYTIPMFEPGVRSLNLSNAVSIVTYHQLHKRGGW